MEQTKEGYYQIRVRESGDVIEDVSSFGFAEALVDAYEKQDMEEGTFTKDFYEIVEVER